MEHIAAFMLLVGCNADASTCTELPVPFAAYEDEDQCNRDLPLQIRLSGYEGERVYGTCKSIGEDAFAHSLTVEWSISKAGNLIVSFDAAPQVVAAR